MHFKNQNRILAVAILFFAVALCLSIVGANPFQLGAPQFTDRQTSEPAAVSVEDPEKDFAAHLKELQGRLPAGEFHVLIEKPFVVISDQALVDVQRSATETVRWAIERLKLDYFSKDPSHIIDIWLFKDKASYEHHNQLLFGSQPHTPFGYYSPANRALVMNISTGGGTLVHEIVHPFMASNFPECPAWFNEGLASLYEQSRDEDGHIMGSTNWRLRGLQLAIEDNRLPQFETLCATTNREFYDGESTNYAQARYLCYFLQEQQILVPFYHEFVKNVATDPSGYQTLQQILGREDMDRFQVRWQEYVAKLRYP